MATFGISDFRAGLDLRKPANIAEAGRLQRLVNCYATAGGAIRKRPAFLWQCQLPDGCSGLSAFNNQLTTFAPSDFSSPMPASVQVIKLDTNDAIQVEDVKTFLGKLYVAAKTLGDSVAYKQYFANASPAVETREWGTMIVRILGKMFTAGPPYSGSLDTDAALTSVAFSATNNPTDWTTDNDAGFLPTDANAEGSKTVVGLANFNGDLAVFLPDAVQTYTVDPDPAKMALKKAVSTAGLWSHASIAKVNGEVLYLSSAGFRSLGVSDLNENLQEYDVGTPVDALVVPLVLSRVLYGPGIFYAHLGQYICFGTNMAMVLTISKSSKLAAWSYYQLPFTVQFACTANDGSLYVLDELGNVYLMDRDNAQFSDTTASGIAPIGVEIETAFIDMKKPNSTKMVHAADFALDGRARVAFRSNPNEDFELTPYIDINEDTRVGGVVPVGLLSTGVGVSIRHGLDEEFELRSIGFQFDDLGVF